MRSGTVESYQERISRNSPRTTRPDDLITDIYIPLTED
jgi:hypothetical protein